VIGELDVPPAVMEPGFKVAAVSV